MGKIALSQRPFSVFPEPIRVRQKLERLGCKLVDQLYRMSCTRHNTPELRANIKLRLLDKVVPSRVRSDNLNLNLTPGMSYTDFIAEAHRQRDAFQATGDRQETPAEDLSTR
jgi:hypothetical protein